MATLKTKFSVGLFLIIGTVVIIVGVIWLGLSNYLDRGRLCVSYFDESVQGLDKDSAVKYRGVTVGRVQAIGVAPDERLIEVVLQIGPQLKVEQISDSIVAQLKSVGITGLMFIELDRRDHYALDDTPALSFKPPYPLIPTRPSEISKIFKGIDDIFTLFRSLDTAISTHLTAVLRKIDHTIDQAQLTSLIADLRAGVTGLKGLVENLNSAATDFNRMTLNADGGIDEIRSTVTGLDRAITETAGRLPAISDDLQLSAAQIRLAMESAAALLQHTDYKVDALQRQTLITLQRVEQAGQTLNRLLERVNNQPSQLIFSQPAHEKPAAP